ncbi:response regulator [Rhodoferax sp. GW822-FHT02A01]|uniref:hybrid sensor histidine kinase/response regulator n=1 Tax=Rhodoferax sp. GW822-FHT02A01 TaxID=3141537 RepID=UPI00315C5220
MIKHGQSGNTRWPKWPLQRAIAVFALVVGVVICVLFAYGLWRDYPSAVTLAVPPEEILSHWRKRALYESMAVLAVLLFLAVCTTVVLAQLRRRMQAESALQLSEISVLKSSLPTLWIGSDGQILRVNQATCDLHGYTEAQMLSMTVMDLNPSMPAAHWPGHWKRLRKAGHMQFETTHRTASGAVVPIEAELNFIVFDGREYNFAFLRDLTARKQTEAEIQRSGAMLRGAMDAVDEAFVLFDSDDTLVYCNDKYTQLYPQLRDVVVPGAKFEDMIREGTRRGLYRESQGREEEWIAERLRAHRQGDETRVQVRDDGRVMRVIDRRTPEGNIVGIRIDITDMVRATEEAQEASRYKSQFLANMSHEIRTPMNAILGLLALLQKTELTATQRDYAEKTLGAARSLLGLVNDILDFSKVEAGKMELDLQPLLLERMLDDIAVIASSSVGTKSVEVLFDIAADVPAEVVADGLRLQQVLLNLLGNAIKFTEEGQVVLRIRVVPTQSADAGQGVEFAVMDTGIGIPPDKQEHVFTGFSQAESTTTRRFGGTGLGLAICRRLVALMGAELRLQSTPGQGSTFRFTLPLSRTGRGDTLVLGAQLSKRPLRVLIVDDHAAARDVIGNLTRAWGWHTESVAGGEQALQRLQSNAQGEPSGWDVILLDWQMPGMDGWEAARRIRALPQTAMQRPRIVMLTANSRDTLAVRPQQEQALVECLLFKPVTPRALQDAALGRLPADTRVLQTRNGNCPLAGMRILVVEDNLINQQVAEELLHAEGASVSLAANGQLGVDAVRTSEPAFDVVLMDIQMPVLDGYGATRKIRQELGLTALPIVAMTANAMASDRAACLAAGMNEHVGKPFDTQHLVTVLLQVTGRAPAEFNSVVDSEVEFSSPYLDVKTAVDRLSGMQDVYLGLVPEFVKALDLVDAHYRQAVLQHDMPSLVAQMHSLKGVAATLGAQPLSDHVAGLEARFKQCTKADEALDHLPALATLVQATRMAAERVLQQLDAAVVSSVASPAPASRAHPAASAQQWATAQVFLRSLCALMARSDLDALEQFAQRGDALEALDPDAVDAIGRSLQLLDFRTAMQLCAVQSRALPQASS